jgi:hypothetical protein
LGKTKVGLFRGLGLLDPNRVGLSGGLGLLGPNRIGLLFGLGLLDPRPVGLWFGLGLLGPKPKLDSGSLALRSDSGLDSDSVCCLAQNALEVVNTGSGGHADVRKVVNIARSCM